MEIFGRVILNDTNKYFRGGTNIELLKIFNQEKDEIGVAPRDEVHKNGYWHETFQCWILTVVDDTYEIYFQIRSHNKKDFPNLLDISAAGHILSEERMEDGVREIQEELGIDVSYDQLFSLGIVKDEITSDKFIDKEFANVFMHLTNNGIESFTLQPEEVAGMVKTEFNNFYQLCMGEKEHIDVEGYIVNEDGKKCTITRNVSKQDMVPHRNAYFHEVATLMKNTLKIVEKG